MAATIALVVVAGRGVVHGRQQRGARPGERGLHRILQQLSQESLVGGGRAVLAEQPRARAHELAHLQRGAPVDLVHRARAARRARCRARRAAPVPPAPCAPRAAAKSCDAGAAASAAVRAAASNRRSADSAVARLSARACVKKRSSSAAASAASAASRLAGARARRAARVAENGMMASTRSPSERATCSTTAPISASSARSTLLSTPSTRLPAPCASSSAARLGGLRRLPDREHPDDRVGLLQEVARHALVLGEDRVQPGRVDDLHAAERLDGQKDLDHADARAPRRRAAPVRKRATSAAASGRVPPSWATTRAAGSRAVAKHVDGRGRGRDAGGRHRPRRRAR